MKCCHLLENNTYKTFGNNGSQNPYKSFLTKCKWSQFLIQYLLELPEIKKKIEFWISCEILKYTYN